MSVKEHPEEYIALLEQLERDAERYRKRIADFFGQVDACLATQDTDALIALQAWFSAPEGREVLPRSIELLWMKYIIAVLETERAAHVPLFTADTPDHRALKEKYTRLVLYLRRIEMDFPVALCGEGLRYLRQRRISPYAVCAVLYNPVSSLGHREKILLTLASDALGREEVRGAYQWLSMIQDPSAETRALMRQLEGTAYGRA